MQVKHIQEEYQKYMERVRGKAQSAIDQANSMFQGKRGELTSHVDTLVHYMQGRFLMQARRLQSFLPPYLSCFDTAGD